MRFLFLLLPLAVSFTSLSQSKKEKLDALVDNWHLAAAKADFQGYFGFMSDDFVFLGTAPEERWSKKEFAEFSRPYFDQGKAWDFKAVDRNWEMSANKKIIWFDENLDTWMQGCRGAGILIKHKGEWKIAYYNLTVLIENEKMKEFLELRNKK